MYRLDEVLLLVTCATISSCDDFDEIVAWGEHHLGFLRGFPAFHFGIPCERWLRTLVNRVDPTLFARCFESWIAALWPDRHDLIAIDGKTARRTHDRRKGLKALHTLSAYATNARLTLAQLSVPEKTNEITAIPDLSTNLPRPSSSRRAGHHRRHGLPGRDRRQDRGPQGRLSPALKGNQPPSKRRRDYFAHAPAGAASKTTVEKGHGRIETRTYTASNNVDWIVSERNYPGEPRFPTSRLSSSSRAPEYADRCSFDTRHFISSAPCDIERMAAATRGHWGVESMHWLLDVEFKEDLSRYRAGHGAKNMAAVRRFALGLVRANKAKGSVKNTPQKSFGWNP